MQNRNAQEHLQWCVQRALEYFDENDKNQAVASFMSDVRKHPGTAYICDSPVGMMSMLIIKDAYERGREEFKKAMEGFTV